MAITDDAGDVTFAGLNRRVNALSRAWSQLGIGPGTVVAALCRDHRNLIAVIAAAKKVGAQLVLMNTGFAKPQLADVARREGVSVLVHDHEFTGLLDAVDPSVRRFLSDPWPIPDTDAVSLERADRVDVGRTGAVTGKARWPDLAHQRYLRHSEGRTARESRRRCSPRSSWTGSRAGGTRPVCMAAPIFHGTGLGQAVLSLALGNRLVLRRKFDPEATLRAVADYRCNVLVVVPTMLQRILALPTDVLDSYDTSSLRIIFASGSAMPADLVHARTGPVRSGALQPAMARPSLAVMTVAMPDDLAYNPATVGQSHRSGAGSRCTTTTAIRSPRQEPSAASSPGAR